MNRTFATLGMVGLCTVSYFLLAEDKTNPPANNISPTNVREQKSRDKQSPERSEAEKQIRKSADEFVMAYNAQDAKAIANQFTQEAEFIDADGNLHEGRDQIETYFASFFDDEEDNKIGVEITSIRFPAENIAVEDGRVIITDEERGSVPSCRYTATHIRENGKWLVASARDFHNTNDSQTPHEHLRSMEWMVGQWYDEGYDGVISITCKWDESKNFLLRDYSVHVGGRAVMSGSQRIGWDPLTKQIRTWTFDSEGGHATGFWHREGNHWVLQLTGVGADGRLGSATQIYTVVNNHQMTWRAVNRSVGNTSLPDIDEVVIVRGAPEPVSFKATK